MEAISFSAHADFEQTSGFLDALRPPHVVLVHGEVEGMKRLREALERGAAAQGFERRVHMPPAGRAVLVAHKCVMFVFFTLPPPPCCSLAARGCAAAAAPPPIAARNAAAAPAFARTPRDHHPPPRDDPESMSNCCLSAPGRLLTHNSRTEGKGRRPKNLHTHTHTSRPCCAHACRAR